MDLQMLVAIILGILLVLFSLYVGYIYFFQDDEIKTRKFSSIVESFEVVIRSIWFVILGIGFLGFIIMIVDFINRIF